MLAGVFHFLKGFAIEVSPLKIVFLYSPEKKEKVYERIQNTVFVTCKWMYDGVVF